MTGYDERPAVDRAPITNTPSVTGGTDRAPTPLAAALWYASQGLRVFPLQRDAKTPIKGSHGFKDATADPDQICRWWDVYKVANVGIATGHLVDVVDIDGPDGQATVDAMEDLPPVLGVVATPRGRHLYLAACGLPNRAGTFPHVDTRGAGGYVVAPPSVVNGRPYTWERRLILDGGARGEIR